MVFCFAENSNGASHKSTPSITNFSHRRSKKWQSSDFKNNKSELAKASALTGEFHKIGINLNQIAHHLNGGYELTHPVADDLISREDDLRKLTNKINSILEK